MAKLSISDYLDTLRATQNNLQLIQESVADVIDICATESATITQVIAALQSAND